MKRFLDTGQLWDLMSVFGPMIRLGSLPPFDVGLKIDIGVNQE